MTQAIKNKRIAAGIALSGLVFLSVFGVFCFGMPSAMGMDATFPMNNASAAILSCMDTQNNVCMMSIAKHVDQWESALLGISQSSINMLFALAALFAAGLIHLQRNQHEALWRQRLRLQRWRSVLLKPLDSLLRAFSQGILHSQIYA